MDFGFTVYKLEIMCSKLARYILAADQINEAIFLPVELKIYFPWNRTVFSGVPRIKVSCLVEFHFLIQRFIEIV